VTPPPPFREPDARDDRDTLGRERAPHGHLVHADRGGDHAGADVRHVEGLQVTLEHSVLAVRPVYDGESDIEPIDDRLRALGNDQPTAGPELDLDALGD
jgi:uncharacterized protein involved in tellurium resistance